MASEDNKPKVRPHGRMLSVAIVGCGKIAGGFDVARSVDALPLSHAGAYSRDGRFELAFCVEPVAGVRDAFARRWEPRASYRSLEDAVKRANGVDIVSICSPTALHPSHVQAALLLGPSLIFCEKPLAQSAAEAASIVDACQEAGVLLAVNHTRRWDPDVIALKAALDEGEMGAVRNVRGYYNGGIINNGSHMIDLLRLFFDPLEVRQMGNTIDDHTTDDPTVAVTLSGRGGLPIDLACGHAADYSLFELEIITSEGSVRMEEGGLRWRMRQAESSGHFQGYRILGEGKFREGRYPQAMARAMDNIYRAVCCGDPLASCGRSALAAQQICEAIRSAPLQSSF